MQSTVRGGVWNHIVRRLPCGGKRLPMSGIAVKIQRRWRLLENDHAAGALAALHRFEAVVDLVQAEPVGDEVVEG